MRRILLISAVWVISCYAASATGHRLFTISKNTNGNYVCFDLRADIIGTCQRDRVMSCYWELPERGTTKALSLLEQMVYGYTIRPDTCDSYRISFHRFPRQPIWLVNCNGSFRAMTSVAERTIWLDDIHLVFEHCSVKRPVTRIELRGWDTGDGGEAILTIDPAVSRTDHPPATPAVNLHLINRGSTSP